ncbi:putative RNA recognition motif domain, nucleotide-binding alpha-beta plait domain superfamily [Helianthus debilis subsp. tardiflorus]
MNGQTEREDDRPWHQATGKRKKKKQHQNYTKQHFEFENATTFFVSNFPNFCTRGEIWNELRVFGDIKDVFIPKKLDKGGNRFAFVRYENVDNSVKMMEVLNKVRLKGAKLAVDMAKFRRDGLPFAAGTNPEVPVKKDATTVKPPNPLGSCSHVKVNKPNTGDNRTYSGVLTGSKADNPKPLKPLIFQGIKSKSWNAWGSKTLIVEAKSVHFLCNLLVITEKIDRFLTGIRYIGGLRVLMTFAQKIHCDAFLDRYNEKQSKWFSMVKQWEGADQFVDRIAWLRIDGVPVKAWDNKVFDTIARTFGHVVSPSGATIHDCNLSFEIVGVLVNHGREVVGDMSITWEGVDYKIWITEVMRDWVPDFLTGSSGWPKKSQSDIPVDTDNVATDRNDTPETSGDANKDIEDGESLEVHEQSRLNTDTCMGGVNHEAADTLSQENFSKVVPDMCQPVCPIFTVASSGGPKAQKTGPAILRRLGSGPRNNKPNGLSTEPISSPRQPATKRPRCEGAGNSETTRDSFDFPLPPYPDSLRPQSTTSLPPNTPAVASTIITDDYVSLMSNPAPTSSAPLPRDNRGNLDMDQGTSEAATDDPFAVPFETNVSSEVNATILVGRATGMHVDNCTVQIEDMVRGDGENMVVQ